MFGVNFAPGYPRRYPAEMLMFDADSSVAKIEAAFPVLSSALHDEVSDGLLHVQMGVFSHLAQSAIDDAEIELWDKITSVFIQIYANCSDDVQNAFNVSFLEHLNFIDGKQHRSWAFNAMPPAMKVAWKQMDAYNRRLHGG